MHLPHCHHSNSLLISPFQYTSILDATSNVSGQPPSIGYTRQTVRRATPQTRPLKEGGEKGHHYFPAGDHGDTVGWTRTPTQQQRYCTLLGAGEVYTDYVRIHQRKGERLLPAIHVSFCVRGGTTLTDGIQPGMLRILIRKNPKAYLIPTPP